MGEAEDKQLLGISDALTQLNLRLDKIEQLMDTKSKPKEKKEDEKRKDFLIKSDDPPTPTPTPNDSKVLKPLGRLDRPLWLESLKCSKAKEEFLTPSEEFFWKELIEKYLRPIEKNEKKEKEAAEKLKDLRNQSVFTFFMINAIYVTVVFLLTLSKDEVSIRWPLQISYEIEYSYDPTINSSSVIISKTFLKLEPIGLTLVIFFSTILLIQFGAMLFHRIGTFMQVMAHPRLNQFNQLDDVQIAHLAQSKKCLDESDGSITVNLDN